MNGQRCAAFNRRTRVQSGRCMTPPWLPGPCMALKEVAGREPTFAFVCEESWGAELRCVHAVLHARQCGLRLWD